MAVALACPLTQLPLLPAPEGLVQRLQALAAIKALRSESARLVPPDFSAAWLVADGSRVWLIRQGLADFSPGAAVLLGPGEAELQAQR